MASVYELTEDEIKLLLDALDLYRLEGNCNCEEITQRWDELKEYLQTRERK